MILDFNLSMDDMSEQSNDSLTFDKLEQSSIVSSVLVLIWFKQYSLVLIYTLFCLGNLRDLACLE
jgi:hypothetical protein